MHFREQLEKTTERVINKLTAMDGVKVYSKVNPSGIVSFSIKNYDSITASDILNSEYDIAVRGGFHCAPLTHKYLKTEKDGLIRASLAVQNSSNEISRFLEAIDKISSKSKPF